MHVSWQKFGWVEVQVFKPETPARQAILFCPGFPGLGSSVFEQRHASALTHEGYDLYVIHHKGTRTNTAMSPAGINNGKRLQDAWESGETHLGGGAVTVQELLDEPRLVLDGIAAHYDSLHIIGNSFGSLSSLSSLTSDGAPVDKVKNLILLAGAQGVDDGTPLCVMRIWNPVFMMDPRITDQIEVKDVPGAIDILRQLYHDLPERVMARLPGHIAMTYVVVEKDEILRLSDTQAFQAAIGGRGTIVMEQDEGWPAYGITPHYTANFRTSKLLKLIRG
jgi:hypothetical protein